MIDGKRGTNQKYDGKRPGDRPRDRGHAGGGEAARKSGSKRPGRAVVVLGLSLLALLACGDEREGTTVAVKARPSEGRGAPARTASSPPAVSPGGTHGASVATDAASSTTLPPPPDAAVIEADAARPVTYGEAEEAYLQGAYDEAFRRFSAYVGHKPENPWGYYMLGLSAWKSGLYGEAERALETSLSLDPLHVKSLVNLGRVLLEVGRPEEAEGYLLTALELDPSADVHRVLGRTRHEMGDLERAADDFRNAILIDEEDAWSMNNLGLALIQQGRYEEALGPLARATMIRNDVAVFHNNLGVALERTDHRGSALAAYQAALELDGSYEKASVSLERLSGLPGVDPSEPVDLETVARGFEDEVQSWRRALEAVGAPDEPHESWNRDTAVEPESGVELDPPISPERPDINVDEVDLATDSIRGGASEG